MVLYASAYLPTRCHDQRYGTGTNHLLRFAPAAVSFLHLPNAQRVTRVRPRMARPMTMTIGAISDIIIRELLTPL